MRHTRKTCWLFLLVASICFMDGLHAQSYGLPQDKRPDEARALKEARKTAKQMKKEGWVAAPGALPLETQLYNLWLQQYAPMGLTTDTSDGGTSRYIFGRATSKASTYMLARRIALTRARTEVAGNLQTEITSLTNISISNMERAGQEAESITQFRNESMALVQQNIGETPIVLEAYREHGSQTEVTICVSYDWSNIQSRLLQQAHKPSPHPLP